jgi:hypothetical protein
MFIAVFIFLYGLRTVIVTYYSWFNDNSATIVVEIRNVSRCSQQRHVKRRCRVFRGFENLVDDDVEQFGGNENGDNTPVDYDVLDIKEIGGGESVDNDELDVIEQCYGVKPILMSEKSFVRRKSSRGKTERSFRNSNSPSFSVGY